MAINLSKNSSISLTKAVQNLSHLTVGLGWDAVKAKGFLSSLFGSKDIDLDASCILLDEGKTITDTIWFRKLTSKCGAVKHKGDNRQGVGDGDDEQIAIDLNTLPKNVKYIVIAVNSYSGQTFEDVDNSFCRIIDQSNKEICRYTLNEQGKHTGLFIGLLTLTDNEWHFTSKGIPISGKTVNDFAFEVGNYL